MVDAQIVPSCMHAPHMIQGMVHYMTGLNDMPYDHMMMCRTHRQGQTCSNCTTACSSTGDQTGATLPTSTAQWPAHHSLYYEPLSPGSRQQRLCCSQSLKTQKIDDRVTKSGTVCDDKPDAALGSAKNPNCL